MVPDLFRPGDLGPPPSDRSAAFMNPLVAAGRHPLLFLLPIVVLLAVAVALGLQRHPLYTAQAQLSVGRLDVNAQAIPGYVQASDELAGTYSRVLDAAQVIDPAARKLGRSPAYVQAHVSASPLAVSQIIVVQATGSTSHGAIALVNLVTNSLAAYVATLNNAASGASASLLSNYHAVASQLQRAQNLVGRLQAAHPHPMGSQISALNAAQAQVSIAQLRVNAIGTGYVNAQQALPGGNSAQVLAAASVASSDRRHTLELLLVSAAVAGIVLGLVLASLRARSRAKYR